MTLTALTAFLMCVVALKMGRRGWPALAAVLVLVASPAYMLWSRAAPDALHSLPFVLAWLCSVIEYERHLNRWWLVASGLILGVGCYSSTPAIVLMPVYLLVTLIPVHTRTERSVSTSAAVLAAFVVPTVFGMAMLARDPSIYADYVQRYRIYDAHRLTPLQGLKDFLNYDNVQERISVYWDYFDPVYLFAAGGADTPTVRAGVLPLAAAVLVPLGIAQLLGRGTVAGGIVIAGIATAPLAAILVDERYVARRELVLLPFAALAAAAGIEYGLSRGWIWRLTTWALLTLTAVQAAMYWVRG